MKEFKDFLTYKIKALIFHFREGGPTEVHPLFITSVGRGIIKVTEVQGWEARGLKLCLWVFKNIGF